MKLIVLNGAKHTKKTTLALRLASNSDVQYVRPCTSKKDVDCNFIEKEQLDKMKDECEVLSCTTIKGIDYVFFKHQFNADYNIIIADDYAVIDILNNWNDDILLVRCVSENQGKSERFGSYICVIELVPLSSIIL